MPYDLTTDNGKVRLLISDIGGGDGATFLFSDDEINAFLALRPDVRMAAALALCTIAGNEVQVAKRITLLDLQTDGPDLAASLLKLADSLEQSVDDDALIDFAQLGTTPSARAEMRRIAWWL